MVAAQLEGFCLQATLELVITRTHPSQGQLSWRPFGKPGRSRSEDQLPRWPGDTRHPETDTAGSGHLLRHQVGHVQSMCEPLRPTEEPRLVWGAE